MLGAALQMLFRPFEWTLAVACLATVVTLAHLLGPNPLGIAFVLSGVWAVLSWVSVAPTRRFRDLMAEHEDMYILQHASRHTRRSVEGRSAKERHERLMAVMRRASRKAWKVSAAVAAVVCAVSVFGSYTVLAKVRPERFDDARLAFEGAWNGGRLEEVGALFRQDVQAQRTQWLANVVEGHGWTRRAPALTDGELREDDGRTWIDYHADDVALSACFALHEQRWRLVDLDVPPPPLEATLDRFLAAWRRSDATGLAVLFPEEHVERMEESILHSISLRGWKGAFPEIRVGERSEGEDGTVLVPLYVEAGVIQTKWLWRDDGRWWMHALRFPERKKKKS